MTSSQRCLLASAAFIAMLPAVPAWAQSQPAPAPTPAPKPADGKPGEIVVTGTKSEVTAAPDRVSFNVTNDLGVQTGTLADALRAVPGVEVDLQGNVSLRGDSGVTILVDGRPAAVMRGENRGEYLLATPANSIERVEVITNPSAAFSPEGSGGVINLVTKKARPNTRFATIRASGGTQGRAALGASGTMARPGVSLTSDLNYRRGNNDASVEQLRTRRDTLGNAITTRQDSTQTGAARSLSGRLGVDYDIDKKNRLSAEGNYYDGRVDAPRFDHVVSSDPAGSYDRDSNTAVRSHGMSLRGSWRRTLPGTGHEFAADLTMSDNRFSRIVTGATTPAIGVPLYERIRNAGTFTNYGAKLDYKRPMGEERSLNIGYQFDLNTNSFDFSGARGPSAGTLLPVASLTNRFDYEQAVHAVYATYAFPLGKFSFQPGLRLEQADITIDDISNNVRADSGYFRVYPTLHVGYELSPKETLRASYSRRIQRPSPQDLNPYTLYIDPLNLRRGNPNLRPEVTDSFELALQKRSGGTFYALTLFYRASSGGVTDVVQDLGGGAFLTTRANLATNKRVGGELVASGKFSKTFSYSGSATFLWNEIDPRLGGVSTPRRGTTGTVRANLTWQPTPKDFFQLTGFWSGDQLVAQGYRESGGMLNLGYRRKLGDRFSLTATAQDVLDSARYRFVIDTPLIHDRITQRGQGRVFLLTLTYTAGSQGGRKAPDRGIDFDPGAGGGVAQ